MQSLIVKRQREAQLSHLCNRIFRYVTKDHSKWRS